MVSSMADKAIESVLCLAKLLVEKDERNSVLLDRVERLQDELVSLQETLARWRSARKVQERYEESKLAAEKLHAEQHPALLPRTARPDLRSYAGSPKIGETVLAPSDWQKAVVVSKEGRRAYVVEFQNGIRRLVVEEDLFNPNEEQNAQKDQTP